MKYAFQYILIFVVLSLIGALLLPKLSVRLSPSGAGQSLTVSYSWAGASPLATESQATTLLEGTFATLQGVQTIKSVSGYGYGYITLILDKNAPQDALRFEVSALIRQVFPKLPKGISYPHISLNTPEQQNKDKPLVIMQLGGYSSATELYNYAFESLRPAFAQVEGVYEVAVEGGNANEWRVEYQATMLNNLQLQESDLWNAIATHFEEKRIGIFSDIRGHQLFVRQQFDTKTDMEEALSNIHIKTQGNRILRLKDIAKIKQVEQSPRAFYRINGKTALSLVIKARVGANELSVAKAIRLKTNELSRQLPPNYQLKIEYDASEFIAENLQKISVQVIASVLILLIFMVLSTRSWWYVWVLGLGMAVNLLLSALLFYALNVEIHLYSLAALTTSLGIIIDNLIVMIEHYRRYQNRQVFSALLGATLSTCAGLVVIWFLPEVAQAELKDFGIVMLITLGISLVVAMVFVPALIQKFKPKKYIPKSELPTNTSKGIIFYQKIISPMLRYRWGLLAMLGLVFGTPFFMLPSRIDDDKFGAVIYNSIFDNEVFKEDIRPKLDLALGGTLRLFVAYVYEGSYFTKPEQTALYIRAELPNNSPIEQMNAIFVQLEQAMKPFAEIDRYVTQVYSGQQGSMVIYFKPPFDLSSFPFLLKNKAIALSTNMSGINWNIYGVGQGFSQNVNANPSPTFMVKMQGYTYAMLEIQAIRLKESLEKHPRIQEVNITRNPLDYTNKDLNEYILSFDQSKLAYYQLNANTLSQTLLNFTARPSPNLFAWHNEKYQAISLRPKEAARFDVFAFNHFPFKQDSINFNFEDIAKINKVNVMPEIMKENQEYIRWLSYEYMGSQHFGQLFLDKTLDSLRPSLPIGYRAKTFQNDWFSDNPNRPYELIGLIMLLIYLICTLIFENLLQPLALISLIPLSYMGVFLIFYWTESPFDQGGYASFILLAGNVVCAGIFLISEWNTLQKKQSDLSKQEKYFMAFEHKFRAIWLTVLSTVVGLVPFLFYENEPFWFALGLGTCGGLLMSLLVILIALPLMLLKAEKKS